jgi:hypothetical protein
MGLRAAPATELVFLSGQGPRDAKLWQFSIDGGRRVGERTSIPVPSNWELQGFGSYRYGQERNKEVFTGHYSTRFELRPEWRGQRIWIVFAGVMTDCAVRVNGRLAGPVHQGGFTQFRYDITPLVKPEPGSANDLEVAVTNASGNADTELAERGGDYWVFGGIYRPVWLEVLPVRALGQVAVDARADGSFTADISLSDAPTRARFDGQALLPERVEVQVFNPQGGPAGPAISRPLPAGGAGQIRLAGKLAQPLLWTAETPHLYTLRVQRWRARELLHSVSVRFGFRTFEVRDGDGLYLNGKRILLKGVNLHSFRPETGRALDKADCFEDARRIRSLNMNAVRIAHYPPDAAFLDACDEMGIYVLDEFPGWQHANDTVNGRLLVREMVERDVNHPSILFWDNGNEGGFNRDLDAEFRLYDPQERRVLHPWDTFSGIDTKHYLSFPDYSRRLGGPHLVMPTEILHAIYDGGGGAGLEDYWHAMQQSRFGAGLFIWSLADEGVVRTDQQRRVDVFSTFGPDGIVGPHFEKEGSYYAVKDIWCPVQIERPQLSAAFTGKLAIRNDFDFTSLSDCQFRWQLLPIERGAARTRGGPNRFPAVAPHAAGTLQLPLPRDWQSADALQLVATDPFGQELWTWSWPTEAGAKRARRVTASPSPEQPAVHVTSNRIVLTAAAISAEFDPVSGTLAAVRSRGLDLGLSRGPRLVFARPAAAAAISWWLSGGPFAGDYAVTSPQPANLIELQTDLDSAVPYASMTLELSRDQKIWQTVFAGSRRPGDGFRFEFPPQIIAGVRVSGLRGSDGSAPHLQSLRIGYQPGRFPQLSPGTVKVRTGIDPASATQPGAAWLESSGAGFSHLRWTLGGAGDLRLDFQYRLDGIYLYHGITFDLPEPLMTQLDWTGEGPSRVWQNRLRGTSFGAYHTAWHQLQPGESWDYPEFQGYFSRLQSCRLGTLPCNISITPAAPGLYLRIGTPRISHPDTSAPFPPGDLSFLFAIPGMGSKFKTLEQSGPAAQPAHAAGTYAGSLQFRFGD